MADQVYLDLYLITLAQTISIRAVGLTRSSLPRSLSDHTDQPSSAAHSGGTDQVYLDLYLITPRAGHGASTRLLRSSLPRSLSDHTYPVLSSCNC